MSSTMTFELHQAIFLYVVIENSHSIRTKHLQCARFFIESMECMESMRLKLSQGLPISIVPRSNSDLKFDSAKTARATRKQNMAISINSAPSSYLAVSEPTKPQSATAERAPISEAATPSTVVTFSDEAKSLAMTDTPEPAQKEKPAPGTAGSDKPFSGGEIPEEPIIWYDPIFTEEDIKAIEALKASPPLVMLKGLSGQAQMDNYDKEYREYTIQPKETSNKSLLTVSAELVKLQGRIESTRPSMLGKSWDFVLKDNKIEVMSDNLSSKDRQWLENALNKNQKLFSSVERFYSSVVKYYENTQDHAMGTVRNWTTGQLDGFASNVADQINGKLAVRDVMDKTIASFSQPAFFNRMFSLDKEKPFSNAVEFVTSYLKVEDDPEFRWMNLDLSDPTTAQYVKDHQKWWL